MACTDVLSCDSKGKIILQECVRRQLASSPDTGPHLRLRFRAVNAHRVFMNSLWVSVSRAVVCSDSKFQSKIRLAPFLSARHRLDCSVEREIEGESTEAPMTAWPVLISCTLLSTALIRQHLDFICHREQTHTDPSVPFSFLLHFIFAFFTLKLFFFIVPCRTYLCP